MTVPLESGPFVLAANRSVPLTGPFVLARYRSVNRTGPVRSGPFVRPGDQKSPTAVMRTLYYNVLMTAVVMTNTAHPEKILVESEKIFIQ